MEIAPLLTKGPPSTETHLSEDELWPWNAAESLWTSSGDPYIENHPGWARTYAEANGDSIRILAQRRSDALDSYSVIQDGNGALVWTLGEFMLMRKRIRRLHLAGGQVYAPASSVEERQASAEAMLDRFATEAKGRVVFVQALPEGSPLHQAIVSGRHSFWTLKQGKPEPHYVIDLPGSVEAFYEGLGYKTRKSYRYDVRKLERHVGGDLSLASFSGTADIPAFLDKAIAISERTYQYRLLQTGLRDRDKLLTMFTRMAERGWWRGYLLSCKGEPTSFIYGYRVGQTFYYWDIGYLPSWQEWSVGKVATLRLIEKLIGEDNPPKRFDFRYGNNEYKRHLANKQWDEQNFYLFPKSLGNLLTVQSLTFVNRTSAAMGNFLAKHNLKAKLKKIIRRRATEG